MPELKAAIETADTKQRLEDLYLISARMCPIAPLQWKGHVRS